MPSCGAENFWDGSSRLACLVAFSLRDPAVSSAGGCVGRFQDNRAPQSFQSKPAVSSIILWHRVCIMHPQRHCQAGWPWLCKVLWHRALQGQQERAPAFCGSAEVPAAGTVSTVRAAGEMGRSVACISLPVPKLPVCSLFLCRSHFLCFLLL